MIEPRLPALDAYIRRIGATKKNFKRYVVQEEENGYPREVAVIRIVDGKEIKCSSEDYAPTEDENEKIVAELAKADLPFSLEISHAEVDDLLRSGRITGTPYVFYSLDRKCVRMVQERRDGDEKYFIPWSMFMVKGGSPEWMQMEPDGPLPHWKPAKDRQRASVMVHEGAKAAKFCDDLVNSRDQEWVERRKTHPWIQELACFEHWGSNGGAYRTHRCDFKELHEANFPGDVVYVCDNDHQGEEAVRTFSKSFAKPMLAILFGEDFSPGWDLAEDVPNKALLNGVHRLMELARPATFATKVVGHRYGRDQLALHDHFAVQWAHSITPELYINQRWPRLMYAEKDFNNYVAPFVHHRTEVSELLQQRLHGQVQTIKYKPGLASGFHPLPNGRFFNVFEDEHHEPYGPKDRPDLGPIEDFFTMLITIERDRHETKRWLATLFARPEVKMRYGLLLVSEMQGVGKTTVGVIARGVIGKHNTSSPSEGEIVDQAWTYWMERRLVLINEIYAGHSSVAYNRLKDLITDEPLWIKKKFLAPYEIDNHVHVIACSNSLKALKLENTDRRWFVPKVTEQKQAKEYWERFYDWLYREQGFRKFKHWAKKFLETCDPVHTAAEAPVSDAKNEMVRESYSPGMHLIDGVLEWIKHAYEVRGEGLVSDTFIGGLAEARRVVDLARRQEHFIMFDKDGRRAISETIYRGMVSDKLESANTIRKVAKAAGFSVGKERIKTYGFWKGANNAWIISLSPELAGKGAQELFDQEVVGVDLALLARDLEEL
jgi:Family of unknown function (DUF5906)